MLSCTWSPTNDVASTMADGFSFPTNARIMARLTDAL